MHEKPTLSPAQRMAQEDRQILAMLTGDERQVPWAEDEIARAVAFDPADSLQRLYAAGLIHRNDGFVWAARAAIVATQLHG
jgi:hypothetical protein